MPTTTTMTTTSQIRNFSLRLPSHVRSAGVAVAATLVHTIKPNLCVFVLCISDLSILERILQHIHQPQKCLEVLLLLHFLLLFFLFLLLPFLYTISFLLFDFFFPLHRRLSPSLLSLLLLTVNWFVHCGNWSHNSVGSGKPFTHQLKKKKNKTFSFVRHLRSTLSIVFNVQFRFSILTYSPSLSLFFLPSQPNQSWISFLLVVKISIYLSWWYVYIYTVTQHTTSQHTNPMCVMQDNHPLNNK